MKLLKIVLINLFLIFVFLFVANFWCYKIEVNRLNQQDEHPDFSFKRYSYPSFYKYVKQNILLQPVGLNYERKQIILFGCSFAYGQYLNNNQKFSYKLSQIIERPVFNRALPGGGLQHMLYQLSSHELDNNLKKTEYVVYVIMSDHPTRLYNNTFGVLDDIIYLTYKNNNGCLVEQKPKIKFIEGSYLVKEFQKITTQKIIMNDKNQGKNFDYMKMYFEESKKMVTQINPNAKFIILKYMDSDACWYLNTGRWKELEKEGFVVLDTTTLTGKHFSSSEYKLSDGHPNEKAWDLITPAFIKKLNI